MSRLRRSARPFGIFDNGKVGGGIDLIARWDLDEAEKRYHPHFCDQDESVYAFALSADGRWALTGHWRRLVLWDLTAGKRHREFNGLERLVRPVALSPDAKYAISAQEAELSVAYDGGGMQFNHQSAIHVWNLQAEAVASTGLSPKWPRAGVASVAVCGEQKVAVSASGRRLVQWSIETGAARSAANFPGRICSVAVGAGPVVLAASEREGYDGESHYTATLWDLQARNEIGQHELHDGPIKCVYLSGDASLVLSGNGYAFDDCDRMMNLGSKTSLVRWRPNTGVKQALHESWFQRMADHEGAGGCVFVPPGDKIAIGWDVWELETPSWVLSLENERLSELERERDFPLKAHCASGDGRCVAAAWGTQCLVWELTYGRRRARLTVGAEIGALALSRAGDYLLAGAEKDLSFWHVPTARRLAEFPCEFRVTCVALSTDPPWVVCAGDHGGNVLLFEMRQV